MSIRDLLGNIDTTLARPRSRRDVLKIMGLGAALPAAAGVLSACGVPAAERRPPWRLRRRGSPRCALPRRVNITS